MTGLTHNNFPAFFRAICGVDPFPWQQELLTRLATGESGEWPMVLDLPTGSGKTAALDIALFHLALETGKGEQRRAPVRIAFVVDRRLIVDDAYARAMTLARKLKDAMDRPAAADATVLKVAQALGGLAGTGQPLIARRLRGGTPREDDWARTPVQPTILCSTVDQVGSRLLFRGYGVSDSMKPVHAGLLGSDCLILLDEAHLSEPFRQTLEAVGRLRGGDKARAPFGFAVLSATPGQEEKDRFGLSKADAAHPVLARRIEAEKPARLVEKPGGKSDSARADAVAEEAIAVVRRLKAAGIANPAVGVVLNRVARARAVFERIQMELQDTAKVILLIGPARAVDRDARAEELEPIRTGRDEARAGLDRPLVVVATQTIEAGVDIDFDGLVTEAAALDALRQRFGRLNRSGRDITPEAAILAHKEDLGSKADDPVYGNRIKATWTALKELVNDVEVVDLGIQAFGNRIGANAADLAAPRQDAPVLMPAYAHLWSHTAPIPNADPEVALFLHAPDRSPASVQIVWRADIDEERFLKPAMKEESRGETRTRLIELLKLVPPRAAEAIEVPLWAARAWLDRADKAQDDFSDAVEAGKQPEGSAGAERRRAAFRWAGEDSERTQAVYGGNLKNGDLIVVPARYGGCDEWGWSPAEDEMVADVADAALWPYRGRQFAVRVTPKLMVQSLAQEQRRADRTVSPIDEGVVADQLTALLAEHESNDDASLLRAVLEWCESKHDVSGQSGDPPQNLDSVRDICLPARLREIRDQPKGALRSLLYRTHEDEHPRGVVFFTSRGLESKHGMTELGALASTESEEASAASDEPLGLAPHCEHVRAWAGAFARDAGLAPEVADDVVLAAWLHDAGKAYWRYQAYFAGGDPYGPDRGKPLAKTGGKRPPPGAWDRAGLPPHWRHEALSVRAAIAHPAFKRANDPLLVLWLIGTHHGHGRPLFPHADRTEVASEPLPLPPALGGELLLNDEPGPQSLAFDFRGLDWAQAFEALKDRYGIWGLARLEAFVRLADHRASEAGAPPEAAQDRREAAE
jgi:CRISPR-associated endonuclease/helicase Cas3